MAGERFRVLKRFALTANANIAIAASAVGAFAQLNSASFQIDPTQAFRVISGNSGVADGAASGKLVGLNASLVLLASTAAGQVGVRGYGSPFGGVVIGQAGESWLVTDDEYVYGNDYLEVGAHGLYSFRLSADVTNNDAAGHNVNLSFTLLIEIYQMGLTSK